jgi:hypothetical protein
MDDQSAPSAAASAVRMSAVSAEATRCPICGTGLAVATSEARVGGGVGCANALSSLREQQTSPFLDRGVMGCGGDARTVLGVCMRLAAVSVVLAPHCSPHDQEEVPRK